MPVYKKRCSTRDPRFRNRRNIIAGVDTFPPTKLEDVSVIPIPDTEVICNSCNRNIYDPEKETFGYLIYLSKAEVRKDQPYDFYCEPCTIRGFPKAIEVMTVPESELKPV